MSDVQAMVENHLKDLILKTFDPKKADTIFTEEGEVSLNVYDSIHESVGNSVEEGMEVCQQRAGNEISGNTGHKALKRDKGIWRSNG